MGSSRRHGAASGLAHPQACGSTALLVAATAAKEGHQVDVFIAGDDVSLLRPSTITAVVGIGTGSVAEHLEALKAAGAGLWASGQSSAARGIMPDDLSAVGFAASPPAKLVEFGHVGQSSSDLLTPSAIGS